MAGKLYEPTTDEPALLQLARRKYEDAKADEVEAWKLCELTGFSAGYYNWRDKSYDMIRAHQELVHLWFTWHTDPRWFDDKDAEETTSDLIADLHR